MLIIPTEDLLQQLLNKIYFLEETAAMTGTGAYSMNVITGEVFIDELGCLMLAVPDNFVLKTNDCLRLFTDKKTALARLKICLEGGFFERDVLMINLKGKEFWAKATGKPLFNDRGVIVGLKGVFTSIDRLVRKTEEAEQHARIIEAQKDRLIDFAHIVSHNLRSHASNLQLTLETFKSITEPADIGKFKDYLQDISENLNKTLRHLNTVVTTHSVEHRFEHLSLEKELEDILETYRSELKEKEVSINMDFTAFHSICYVKTYLESIFKNLISNAVRFKHPDRACVIDIRTKLLHGKKLLIIADNGTGIDLGKYSDKVFKMYQTFHGNEDARGLGLFVVKNQVQAVNGDISIKSEVNVGTSLTIRF